MEVKSVKIKFTKLAIVMGAVMALMSTISVASMACIFCDESTTAEENTEVVEVVDPEPIPNTDAIA